MKNTFFQYNVKLDGKLDNIMENGIIILDTNALLDIYRVSKESRMKYLEILNCLKDRLFMTFQTAQEFYNNRLIIIYNKCKFKDDLKKELNSKIGEIEYILEKSDFNSQGENSCYLIKYEQNLKNNIVQILNKTQLKIEEEINYYNDEIDESFIKGNDYILDKIIELFEGRVNKKLSKERLEEVYNLAEERYKINLPPGCKDKYKPEPERYEQLVIWNEIIEVSIKQNKGVLFVSDDRKGDWFEKFKEYDLGTRPELIKEFFDKTGHYFHAIKTKSFINSIADLYDIDGTKNLEEELATIREDLINKDFKVEMASDLNVNKLDAMKYQIDNRDRLNNMEDNMSEVLGNSDRLVKLLRADTLNKINNVNDNMIKFLSNSDKIIKLLKSDKLNKICDMNDNLSEFFSNSDNFKKFITIDDDSYKNRS